MNVTRRISGLVLLLVILVVVSNCSTSGINKCARGTPGPFKYRVIITPNGRRADAYPPRLAAHGHWKSKGTIVSSEITWIAPSSKDPLRVEMDASGLKCLTAQPDCSQPGRCVGYTNPSLDFHGQKQVECKYSVWIENQTDPYDPIIVVDDCCANVLEP